MTIRQNIFHKTLEMSVSVKILQYTYMVLSRVHNSWYYDYGDCCIREYHKYGTFQDLLFDPTTYYVAQKVTLVT